jgi:hypothetical protein
LRPRPCIIHVFRDSNKVIVPRRRLKPQQRARPHEPPIDIRLKIGLILAGLMFTAPFHKTVQNLGLAADRSLL